MICRIVIISKEAQQLLNQKDEAACAAITKVISEVRQEMNTYIKEINGIKYFIKVDDMLYFQSQALWRAIYNIPADRLKDGFKIQIGFSLYILQKGICGYCIVTPNYESNPFLNVTEDLTLAFWIQMEQLEMLQKYHINGEAIRFDDKIAIAEGSIVKPQIYLQRFRDLGGSGWCVNEIFHNRDGELSNVDAAEYESVYAYQLLNIRPSVLKSLMLPYDYIVVFDGDDIIEILNEKDESIITKDGS